MVPDSIRDEIIAMVTRRINETTTPLVRELLVTNYSVIANYTETLVNIESNVTDRGNTTNRLVTNYSVIANYTETLVNTESNVTGRGNTTNRSNAVGRINATNTTKEPECSFSSLIMSNGSNGTACNTSTFNATNELDFIAGFDVADPAESRRRLSELVETEGHVCENVTSVVFTLVANATIEELNGLYQFINETISNQTSELTKNMTTEESQNILVCTWSSFFISSSSAPSPPSPPAPPPSPPMSPMPPSTPADLLPPSLPSPPSPPPEPPLQPLTSLEGATSALTGLGTAADALFVFFAALVGAGISCFIFCWWGVLPWREHKRVKQFVLHRKRAQKVLISMVEKGVNMGVEKGANLVNKGVNMGVEKGANLVSKGICRPKRAVQPAAEASDTHTSKAVVAAEDNDTHTSKAVVAAEDSDTHTSKVVPAPFRLNLHKMWRPSASTESPRGRLPATQMTIDRIRASSVPRRAAATLANLAAPLSPRRLRATGAMIPLPRRLTVPQVLEPPCQSTRSQSSAASHQETFSIEWGYGLREANSSKKGRPGSPRKSDLRGQCDMATMGTRRQSDNLPFPSVAISIAIPPRDDAYPVTHTPCPTAPSIYRG